MSTHRAAVSWKRTSQGFSYEEYNREHQWHIGGLEFPGSAAPEYGGKPGNVDPEQAFVASVSSCHMLTFLAIASRRRMVVDAYSDEAVGHLEKGENGKLWVSRIELAPQIVFSGDRIPDTEALNKMHATAHRECFIANSITTEVIITQA